MMSSFLAEGTMAQGAERPVASREAVVTRDGTLTSTERVVALALGLLLLWLRWCYATAHPWNSDEPQHLHIVWAWANGLLPYRDVFDNHTPLFQFLSVPLFRLIGERPEIVTAMRHAMLPLFLLSLWLVFRLGKLCFSARAGFWAVPLVAFLPKYFSRMGEYRPDVAWTVLWLLLLLQFSSGRLQTFWRRFLAGVTFGAAFSVSMKSTLLAIVLATAGAIAWVVSTRLRDGRRFTREALRQASLFLAPILLGTAILPALIVAFFAAHGALGPLWYCVIQHNIMPGVLSADGWMERLWWTMPLAALAVVIALLATRSLRRKDPGLGTRRLFLLLVAGLYYPLLHAFWPTVTPQDDLPLFTVAGLALAPALVWCCEWLEQKLSIRHWFSLSTLLLLVGAELAWLVQGQPPFAQPNAGNLATLREALTLTAPGEYVMDAKGDLIFRPRPYYYVLETLTRWRIRLGMIVNNIPQRLIETRTAVALESPRMSGATLRFIQENYLPAGHLDVLGKTLPPAKGPIVSFAITIPAEYSFISDAAEVAGTIDGKPLQTAQFLGAGPHRLELTLPARNLRVVWSRALARGFRPTSRPLVTPAVSE